MPDLLIELLSEEIPARMQGRAADDLRRLVTDALVAGGLHYEAATAYATPRRLALHVVGLPPKAADLREERRGPRVGAPEAAVAGFLKSVGLASVDELTVIADPKKGDAYAAVLQRPGRSAAAVVAAALPPIVRSFPWPKSMRWGAASREPGSLRWVRPLQSILCLLSTATESEVVPFSVDGVASGDVTRGHRFLAPDPIRVRRFDDYAASLQDAFVVLDASRRREVVRHDARDLAFAQGLEAIEDEALLDEVAGLVEWPVALMGSFDESFLAVPAEVIRATVRANQKCFVLRGADGALAPRFILVSNIVASDGGAAVVAGNERVVRARLSDAKFFWDGDLRTPLEDRLPKLDAITFHAKLGTQGERVRRLEALAAELAPLVGADPGEARRAARLCKADLVTETVGEFPELQGLVGGRLAAAQGEPAAVADAIADHYKPLGPSDRVPTEPVTVAVALADKLDTLVGFWAIGETPTGSKDPYALRRAALGVIRLVLENELRLPLLSMLARMFRQLALVVDLRQPAMFRASTDSEMMDFRASEFSEVLSAHQFGLLGNPVVTSFREWNDGDSASRSKALEAFFHDRLKVHLRERGARHDLIDAVLAAAPAFPLAGKVESRSDRDGGRDEKADRVEPGSTSGAISGSAEGDPSPPTPGPSPRGGGEGANDDLLMVVRRVEALGRLLATPDGANLLAATKRAANILRIEEGRDGRAYDDAPDPAAFAQPEERALAEALAAAEREAGEAVAREDFEAAMRALAALRPAVDAFFDKVTVNAPEPALRANRLRLLARLRAATRAVADFSKIEG